MVDFNRQVYALLGLPFDAVRHEQALEKLELSRAGAGRCFLTTPNLNFLVASQDDLTFRDSVCRSNLSVADGMPVVWLARLLGLPLLERVSGSGLFESLRQQKSRPWRVFFFGGGQGAGQAACLNVGDTPAMQAVGLIYPGFGDLNDMSQPDLIECINASQADFLVVSLGAVKGQEWISRNLSKLKTPVVSHLGAVVNFVAGSVNRAPRWVQTIGFEWLWRIKEEPQLWRRYARDGVALMRLMLTRVLPLAICQRWKSPSADELKRADIQCSYDAHQSIGVLGGAWSATNLDPVRARFSELLAAGRDVTLDMRDCTSIDSAWTGLLMLLDTALRDQGLTLRLEGTTPHVARLLGWHGFLERKSA